MKIKDDNIGRYEKKMIMLWSINKYWNMLWWWIIMREIDNKGWDRIK